MEPVLTTLAGWAVGKIADTVWQGAGDRLDKSLNKSDVEKAIKAGKTAVAQWQGQLPPQELLFYRVSSDGWNNYHKFLDRVFDRNAVLAELQKPLTNQGQPEIEILVKAFQQEAEASNIELVSGSLRPWVERFVSAYFQQTDIYFKSQ